MVRQFDLLCVCLGMLTFSLVVLLGMLTLFCLYLLAYCCFCCIAIHFDLFNGQVAFVQLDTIKKNDVNFVIRQQMEGQSVFEIDQNSFKWQLLEKIPLLEDLELLF